MITASGRDASAASSLNRGHASLMSEVTDNPPARSIRFVTNELLPAVYSGWPDNWKKTDTGGSPATTRSTLSDRARSCFTNSEQPPAHSIDRQRLRSSEKRLQGRAGQ